MFLSRFLGNFVSMQEGGQIQIRRSEEASSSHLKILKSMQGFQNSKSNPCHETISRMGKYQGPFTVCLSQEKWVLSFSSQIISFNSLLCVKPYKVAPLCTTGSTIYQRREGKKVNTWRLVCDARLLGEKCHSTTCSQLQSTYAEVFVKL